MGETCFSEVSPINMSSNQYFLHVDFAVLCLLVIAQNEMLFFLLLLVYFLFVIGPLSFLIT